MTDTVDVLFVDEAGQMSLANVAAAGRAAKNIVLLGDPQQLEQPLQGSHPEGSAVSALQLLDGHEPEAAAVEPGGADEALNGKLRTRGQAPFVEQLRGE